MSKVRNIEIKKYNNYGAHLREKYNNQRVYKVIVDGGFSCPNRDGNKGYGGCIYCNVDSFTPVMSRTAINIRGQLVEGMQRAKHHYNAEKFIVYFQPNSNTYAPVSILKSIYDEALSVNIDEVVGFSVGTRPDCIDAEKIALLESYCDRFDVELEMGMESIYDETLDLINRGYSHAEFVKAVTLLQSSPIDLCVHAVFGLPWETHEMMLKYIDEINRFPEIKFVKFHHLHIVKGSIMAVKYKKNPFKLFTLEEYTDLLCDLIPLLRHDIVIQRLFGISDWDLLITPNWGLKKTQIQTYIEKEIERRGIVQGSLYVEK
jgi:radical SAM protein (TIGR01212 family)